MQRNLFTYIWRHSRPEQVVILGLVVLAQIFYFMSLTVPKSVINNGIQGNAFKDSKTIPFLVWELDLSAVLPGKVLRLFDGFQVDQLQYLVVMSFVFLAAVIINGQFKKVINTQKGRMGERMLRRLRYELYDRILRFPAAHFRKVKQAELATMIKDEVEPLGGFIGDAFVQPMFLGGQALTAIGSVRSRHASSPAALPKPPTATTKSMSTARPITSAPTSRTAWAASSRSASISIRRSSSPSSGTISCPRRRPSPST